jgi:DNA-binding transcriptional regulator YhcF (GntR family)
MKVTIETSVIKTILSDSSASALSVLVALKETLSKIKKVTDEIPTLKQVAKAYGIQERTIKKFLPYLINKGFLEVELIPSEWVSEMKGKISKEVQNVINIVTEAAINAEEPESVNDDVIVKIKAVNSVTIMKKVYYLLPFIISNSYLNNEIVGKLNIDWLSRPLDKNRYKDQLKSNREWKKKQQEKITVQAKEVNDNAIEVEAIPDYTEVPEATKQRFKGNKQDRIFQQKKQNFNRRYTAY